MNSSESLKNQGNEAFKKGDFSEAETLYQQAIVMDPANHVLYSNWSGALINLGRN